MIAMMYPDMVDPRISGTPGTSVPSASMSAASMPGEKNRSDGYEHDFLALFGRILGDPGVVRNPEAESSAARKPADEGPGQARAAGAERDRPSDTGLGSASGEVKGSNRPDGLPENGTGTRGKSALQTGSRHSGNGEGEPRNTHNAGTGEDRAASLRSERLAAKIGYIRKVNAAGEAAASSGTVPSKGLRERMATLSQLVSWRGKTGRAGRNGLTARADAPDKTNRAGGKEADPASDRGGMHARARAPEAVRVRPAGVPVEKGKKPDSATKSGARGGVEDGGETRHARAVHVHGSRAGAARMDAARTETARMEETRTRVMDGAQAESKQSPRSDSGFNGREQEGGRDAVSAALKYEINVPVNALKLDYHIARNADEIFESVVRQFSFLVKKGGGEAHIVLEPELLGRLKMEIKLNQHEVHSLVMVENQSIKDLIISRLNILEQSLLQHGFSLGSFQVEVNDGNPGFSPQNGETAGSRSGSIERLKEEVQPIPPVPAAVDWLSTVINITV
jgi:hypothetical protein